MIEDVVKVSIKEMLKAFIFYNKKVFYDFNNEYALNKMKCSNLREFSSERFYLK